MKYIRTKDGIYEVIEFHTTTPEHESFISDYFCKGLITILAKEVIDISLSIEELCDAFVDTSELKTTNTGGWLYDEFDSDNKCLVYYEHDERKTIPLNEFDDLSKIRGAIWTDKGLIYVAKMNDKGELELI